MADTLEHLFDIFSHPDFLAMKGLSGGAPIFIQTYEPENEDKIRRTLESLSSRLKIKGLPLVVVDLFDLMLEQLDIEGRLEKIVEKEPSLGKKKVFDMLSNLSDPKERLIPSLVKRICGADVKLTLLTGAGRVFPFLRTHTILESLQPAMMNHPIVLFFPGQYIQDEALGSHLRLFGTMTSIPIHSPHYRAINLEHYRL